MRKVGASSASTVFHDRRFWAGMVERSESGRLAVSRMSPWDAETALAVSRYVPPRRRAAPLGIGAVEQGVSAHRPIAARI